MTTTTGTVKISGNEQPVPPKTVAQVAMALERGEAILIDLREPGERAQQGAIPGAVSAPWGTLIFWDELTAAYYRAKTDPRGHVVMYCASGGRAVLATDTLRRMGYANVTSLAGGFFAWQAAGKPVEDAPSV